MKWTLMPMSTLILATACGEHGSGDYSFDSRELKAFLEIENRGEANVYLAVEGSEESEVDVTVTGDDNLIDEVRTWVSGDTLIVETEHEVWPEIELRVVATVGRLVALDNEGSGDVHVSGVDSQDFFVALSGSGDATADGDFVAVEVRSSGSGDVELVGGAESLDVSISASGDVHARDLSVRDATVTVSGSGDVELCVSGTLDAAISGSGDIDYYCNPDTVHPATSGSGDINGH